ncbi:MAG: hypothetical protein GF353_13330 [Candidatus Lokiarchaeota archaeon]|nr:hypothetical protein [Candidatus Lokiarchaeota archaeon]
MGKAIDLLYKLIFFYSDQSELLLVLKIRYLYIVYMMAPLIYFGFIVLFCPDLFQFKTIQDPSRKVFGSFSIIIIISTIESCLILIATDIEFLSLVLICTHIPSLLWISISFLYAYKKRVVSQNNLFIVGIAFCIDLILYVSSLLLTDTRQKSIGFSPYFTIIAESIDLVIIILIFLGFYLKSNLNSVKV